MAGRLDFRARLNALRAPKSAPRPEASVKTAPPSPDAPAYAHAPQTVPTNNGIHTRSQPDAPAPAAPSSVPTAAPAPALTALDLRAALGVEYDQAIAIAQRAVDCERKRQVHDAIKNYIHAGQVLIGLGRKQTSPQLRELVKAKAAVLLQRAEGLDEWAREVAETAGNTGQDALDEAYAQSQLQDDQNMREKELLVTQLRQRNNEISAKLNNFAMLMKVRSRFMRTISDRRAREAEAKRKASERDVQVERQSPSEDEAETDAHAQVEVESPRDRQKRAIVNELHEFIGLPKIDRLRVFKPLSADAARERQLGRLESELEEARRESDRLRAAMEKMEAALRDAEEYTRESSMKQDKEKEEMAAQLQELQQELAHHRRLSHHSGSFDVDEGRTTGAVAGSSPHSNEAYENIAMINRLRASLESSSIHSGSVMLDYEDGSQRQIGGKHEGGEDDEGMWV